jgi:4,5-DOPA dioxygenase extradiol
MNRRIAQMALLVRDYACLRAAGVVALVASERVGLDPARPEARLPVPTPEHYLPLLYAVALQQPHEEAEFFNVSVPGSISMTSVLIGGSATGA